MVQKRVSRSSYPAPRNANGAIRAPVLTPVTSLNSGRSPVAVHPFQSPAPKAPLSPPPEMTRKWTGSSTPRAPHPFLQVRGNCRDSLLNPMNQKAGDKPAAHQLLSLQGLPAAGLDCQDATLGTDPFPTRRATRFIGNEFAPRYMRRIATTVEGCCTRVCFYNPMVRLARGGSVRSQMILGAE